MNVALKSSMRSIGRTLNLDQKARRVADTQLGYPGPFRQS